MEWETSLLGRKLGRIECVDSIRDINSGAEALGAIEQHAAASGFSLMTARVNVDHFTVVWALEAAGFVTADVGVTFEYDLAKTAGLLAPHTPNDLILRQARHDDLPALQHFVDGLFLNSYYYVTPFFSRSEADLLYRAWITNCVEHGRADRVLLAERSGHVLGFITCRCGPDRIGIIELIGVAPSQGSRGIGKALVRAALGCFQELGAAIVRVRTQVTNIAAVNLYSGTGARALKVDTTLIKPLTKE